MSSRPLESWEKKTDLPCDETAEALEIFVCKLYSPGQKHTNTAELRWYLFSQKHAEGEKLPPTRGQLRPHYVTMIWGHADDPLPQLPSPTDYGWKDDNGRLAPVWCLDPPAPQSILLIKCACQKGCTSGRCCCLNIKLPCTELCGCGEQCQNVAENVNPADAIGIDMSDDDSDF